MNELAKKKALKKLPTERKDSVQMNLFSAFLANDDGEDLSNLIEMWEGIPKYFLNDKQQKKLRNTDGLAQPYSFDFVYQDPFTKHEFERTVTIQPALLKQKDGTYKAFFPSVTEEFVEEALKKIFTDQNLGFHDVQDATSWVRFSLRMIYRELKARGRERNITQIRTAIDVMSNCIITVTEGKENIYRGSILGDVIPVDRATYTEDSEKHWIARLPAILSFAINKLRFRQFNMARLLECDEQLSRYIFKRMVSHFRQASLLTDFTISYRELEHSGLLMVRATEGRAKVIRALGELTEHKVINYYELTEEKRGNKIVDVDYKLHPSPEFSAEQKASNKRAKDNFAVAMDRGIDLQG